MEGKEKVPDREDRYVEEQTHEITWNLQGIKSKFIYSEQTACGQKNKTKQNKTNQNKKNRRDEQDRKLERLQGSQYKWSNIQSW